MKPFDAAMSLTNLFSPPLRPPDPEPVATWSDAVGGSWTLLRSYALWEFTAFLWISLLAITFVLSEKVLKVFRLWYLGSRIPGPPCKRFFFGQRKFLRRESITDLLSDCHKNYGSVVKLWLGPKSLLVSIKDPTLINEVLIKAEDKLPLTEKAFRLAFGRSSLFASSFDKVKKGRQSFAMKLNQKLVDGSNLRPTEAVNSVIKQLSKITVERKCDSKMVARNMALTLLGTTLFGDTFLNWSKATNYEELLTRTGKDACLWASYRVTPFWKQEFWRYQHLCAALKCLTQELLQQCGKNCNPFGHPGESLSVKPVNTGSNAILEASKECSGLTCPSLNAPENLFLKDSTEHHAAGEEPSGDMMGVMFHCLLTTAALIDNVLTRLATHSEIQDSIYSEITRVRRGPMKPGHIDADDMPLLLATIYESARILPAGALLQRCSQKRDIKLKNGVVIPAGGMVVVPLQLVQMDSSNWGSDAQDFNPYRFLSRASDSAPDTAVAGAAKVDNTERIQHSFVLNDPTMNPAFLPFGSGTRACLGEKFVIQGVATLLATLLKQYKIKTRQGSSPNPRPVTNNSMLHPRPNLDIVFVSRGS